MKIALCVPAYRRQVDIGQVAQALNLGAFVMKSGAHALDFLFTESCSIEWSRNQLLHQAIRRGNDWALMVDADTFHPRVSDVVRMLEDGSRAGAAVIASPVKMRGRPGYNVFEVEDGKSRFADPTSWRGTVTPVHQIGTAFFAVRCGWIVEHWPEQPWFETQHAPGPEPRKIGEDVTFCDRVRARGGTILADGRFEPVHVGS